MSLGVFRKRNPQRMNNFHQGTVEDGLDGDGPVELGVTSLVYFSHSSRTDRGEDFGGTGFGAGCKGLWRYRSV